MKDVAPKTIYLKDYKVSVFLIEKTNLIFDLHKHHTRVSSELMVVRNPLSKEKSNTLILDGSSGLDLQWVKVNDVLLSVSEFHQEPESLTIYNLPDKATVSIEVLIEPHLNTTMMGLYRSRTMYCTQCEAEGFRDITFYLDRPDVMAEFTTKVIAQRQQYPILLSNGNPIERGELANDRHFVTWHDPFKKPSYLFALVAGTLSVVEDSFTTCSGREVKLQIFVEEKDLDKCDHAMLSLKHSMRWDEEVYGREYDLDIFMIVAVDDFNMGAMENKGLNIFNTSAVLVNPKTSTDAAFQRVEAIVAHEYFHNWSGNRVTCRDWFQLSLKEGFTVFRDSQFSSDMNSATVKRIEDVAFLRSHQFAEDGGPMAHSVQPDSYMEINNFYTVTIYEKGAEVVRMYRTLLGEQTFRAASDLYFERHDGEAATVEDFVVAMEDASDRDLSQFRRWYHQSGTPVLDVTSSFDPKGATYTLEFTQHCPDTAGQTDKKPFVIPVTLGLVDAEGDDMVLNQAGDGEITLELHEKHQRITFDNISAEPVPSLLRGFSAPVKLNFPYTDEQLIHLLTYDSDGFNRWDACQSYCLSLLNKLIVDHQAGRSLSLDPLAITAFGSLLRNQDLDPAMVALMLHLPSESLLHELADVIQPEAIHLAREFMRKALAVALVKELNEVYERYSVAVDYEPKAEQIGARSLKNAALSYLMYTGAAGIELAWKQFSQADNMTDKAAALTALVNCSEAQNYAEKALHILEEQYVDEALVMNLWLQIQATNSQSEGLARVKALLEHSAFTMTNPNKVRSLIGAFCSANLINFHTADGSGYQFLADQIIALNQANPQVAARLVTPLTRWTGFTKPYGALMRKQLQRVADHPNLVKDVLEVASKSL